MVESDNLHPVTKMLLARIEEHPDEFVGAPPSCGRWDHIILRIKTVGPSEDIEVLNRALGKVAMDKIHADAVDELLNGPEHRERERIERETRRIQVEAHRATLAQQLYAQQSNQLGTITGLGSSGYANVAMGGLLGQQTPAVATDSPDTTLDKIRKVLSL